MVVTGRKRVKQMIRKIFGSEMLRYLIFGGCTTMVNLVVFYILRYGVLTSLKMANLTAILTAMIFAFAVNKWYVFGSSGNGIRKTAIEFINFMGIRFITMLIEFYGVEVLVEQFEISDMSSKILVQIVVIVLNYVFSKFWIFKKENQTGGVKNG